MLCDLHHTAVTLFCLLFSATADASARVGSSGSLRSVARWERVAPQMPALPPWRRKSRYHGDREAWDRARPRESEWFFPRPIDGRGEEGKRRDQARGFHLRSSSPLSRHYSQAFSQRKGKDGSDPFTKLFTNIAYLSADTLSFIDRLNSTASTIMSFIDPLSLLQNFLPFSLSTDIELTPIVINPPVLPYHAENPELKEYLEKRLREAFNEILKNGNVPIALNTDVNSDEGERGYQGSFKPRFRSPRFLFGFNDVLLPSYGKVGDMFNEMAEIMINVLTVFFYRDSGDDCARRLLCESNQQAARRGHLNKFMTYTGGLLVSLVLPRHRVSDSLQAMREGRQGTDCIGLFPNCDISL